MSSSEEMRYDLVLVGGSSANFALAHRLVDLAKASGQPFTMAILEKGKEFGAHVLSGLISNPRVIKKLFPDYRSREDFPLEAVCNQSFFSILSPNGKWDVPSPVVPPGMKKEGYLVLSLSHVIYWMYNQLQAKLKECPNITVDFFPGFAAHKALVEGEGATAKITGVQVVEKATGKPDEDNIYGNMVVFGEKGFLSKDLLQQLGLQANPQLWSVGVKELWQLAEGKDLAGKVWHTMGYPLVDGSFGGGFVYGMKGGKLSVGLIASLDSPNPNLDPQQALQRFKAHPWLQDILAGAKLIKYGAALLPEGGYYSLPTQFYVNNALFVGDSLGALDIARLSGVDKAMETGYQAAEVIHACLKTGDFSTSALKPYQQRIMDSFVGKELYEGRYFRAAWQSNPRLLNQYLPKVLAGIEAGNPLGGIVSAGIGNPLQALGDLFGLKQAMEGCGSKALVYEPDHTHIRPSFTPNRDQASLLAIETVAKDKESLKETLYTRADAVFYAGTKYHEDNHHIDEFNADTCVRCIATYDALKRDTPCVSDCTAEVHRIDELANNERRHGMSMENCIQCRTCEIVCPEVNLKVRPTEQGAGPDFMGL